MLSNEKDVSSFTVILLFVFINKNLTVTENFKTVNKKHVMIILNIILKFI